PAKKPHPDGSGVKPGRYAHMGIGIDIPDPKYTQQLSADINRKWPFAQAKPTGPWNEKNEFPGARSIYLKDPDGLILQLIRPEDDGYLFPGSRFPGAPAWNPPANVKPMTRVRTINHVHFDVSDFQRSADFYGELFGATVHEKAPTFWTIVLPTNSPGQAFWF